MNPLHHLMPAPAQSNSATKVPEKVPFRPDVYEENHYISEIIDSCKEYMNKNNVQISGAVNKLFNRGCKACSREELERGCNGEGRIQGGVATVPGFRWWPIKAYRPCPGFVASGGRYRRRGQSMDEVAFGWEERRTPVSTNGDDNPSKKQGGRKFK